MKGSSGKKSKLLSRYNNYQQQGLMKNIKLTINIRRDSLMALIKITSLKSYPDGDFYSLYLA